jgi:hypothetical protein
MGQRKKRSNPDCLLPSDLPDHKLTAKANPMKSQTSVYCPSWIFLETFGPKAGYGWAGPTRCNSETKLCFLHKSCTITQITR